MLNEAGFPDCGIVASNSLDEYIIRDILDQGGQVDSFGVGERLVTAKSDPVFGGVYKLAAVEADGELVPKIKVSENVEKITNPGFKVPWRLYERSTGKAIADVITLQGEIIDDSQPYEILIQIIPGSENLCRTLSQNRCRYLFLKKVSAYINHQIYSKFSSSAKNS